MMNWIQKIFGAKPNPLTDQEINERWSKSEKPHPIQIAMGSKEQPGGVPEALPCLFEMIAEKQPDGTITRRFATWKEYWATKFCSVCGEPAAGAMDGIFYCIKH